MYNHLTHLQSAINEKNNLISSISLKGLISFYKNQLIHKNCSYFEILLKYCNFWDSIREFSFLDCKIPPLFTKLQKRYKMSFFKDPNFSRLIYLIDFEYEFQLYNGLLKFIKGNFSKSPENAIKLLKRSKTILDNILINKTSRKITKDHMLLEIIPIFIEIININLKLLQNYSYSLSSRGLKYQIHIYRQLKDLIKEIDGNHNFQYLEYLLLTEYLINFNIYLKGCIISIQNNELIHKFQYPIKNLPVYYDINLKILVDSFKIFNPNNFNHLIIFRKKLHELIYNRSIRIPILIFLQLEYMIKMILLILSCTESRSTSPRFQELLQITNQ